MNAAALSAAFIEGRISASELLAHPLAERALLHVRAAMEGERAALSRFAQLYGESIHPALLVDAAGRIQGANDALERLLGYANDALRGQALADVLPDGGLGHAQAFAQLRAGAPPLHRSDRLRRSNGALHSVNLSIHLLDGPEPHLLYAIEDVQGAQEMLTLLQDSENRYYRMIASTSDGIWELDARGRTTFVNDALAQMLGYSREDLWGRNFWLYVWEADRDGLQAQMAQADGEAALVLETRLRQRDDSAIWVRLNLTRYRDAAGTALGMFALVSDIRAQKAHEAILEARYARRTAELRSLIDVLPNNIFTVTLAEWRIELCNRTFARAIGYAETSAIEGRLLPSMYSPQEMARFKREIDVMLETGSARSLFDSYEANGETFYFDVQHIPLRNSDGEIDGVLVSAHDTTVWEQTKQRLQAEIAQRVDAEAALRASQGNLTVVLDNLPVPVCVLATADLAPLYHNARLLTLLSLYTLPADFALIAYFDHPQQIRRWLLGGADPNGVDAALRDAVGELRWVHLTVQAIDYGGQAALLVSMVDITQMRAALAREQAVHRTKSRFLSMVAHELRRPLAEITLVADTLQRYFYRLPAARRTEKLTRIATVTANMDILLDELIYIGQSQLGQISNQPQRMDLVDFCQAVALDAEKGEAQRVGLRINPQDDLIWMDPSLLRRILLNLLSNALKYSEAAVDFFVHHDESGTQLVVSDSGRGIPERDRADLFELFYRADNVGDAEGTGIGLNIVKMCVDLMGGTVSFETKVDVGTRFVVWLPLQTPPS